MPISVDFQKRISQLAEDCDCTRTELRTNMNVSSTALSSAITYGIIPTTKTLVKMADFFDVSLNYLLGKTESDNFIRSEKEVSFHERLSELCAEKNVSYYKVGLDCGIYDSLISHWFKKGFIPTIELIEILSDYFNVSPDYLLGRTDFKN